MPPKPQRKQKTEPKQKEQKRTTKRRPRKPRAPKQQAMPTYETGYSNLLGLAEEQNRQVRARQLDTAFSGLQRLQGLYSGLPTSAELALRQRETIYGTDVLNRQQQVEQALKREQDTAKQLQEQKDRFKKIIGSMAKGGASPFIGNIEEIVDELDKTEMTNLEKANALQEALLAGEDRKLTAFERQLVVSMSNTGKITKKNLVRFNKKIYGEAGGPIGFTGYNPVVEEALQQRQMIHTPAQQSANRQPSVAEFEAGLIPITPEPSPRPPVVPPLTHSMFQRVEKFRTASIAGEPIFNNGSMEDTLPTDRTIQTQQQINDTIASPNRFLQYRESQRKKQEKMTQELLSL